MRTTLWMAHTLSAIALTGGLIDPPTPAPELHANSSFFLWFLCALGFLKVSQHMDTILSSLGLHVTKTGGSMLEEVVMAGKAVTGLFKSLGGAVGGAGLGRSHGGGIDGGDGGDHNPPAGADIGITGIADIPMGPSGSSGPDGEPPIVPAPTHPNGPSGVPNPVSMGRPSSGGAQTAAGTSQTEQGKPPSLGDIPKGGKLTGDQAAAALTSAMGYGPAVPPGGVGASPTGSAATASQTGNAPPAWDGPGYPQDVGTGKPNTPKSPNTPKAWDGPGYPADVGTDAPKPVPAWDGPGYPADVGTDVQAPLPVWDGPGYPDDVGSTEPLQVSPETAENPETPETPENPDIAPAAVAADDGVEPVAETAPGEDSAPDVPEADLGEGEPIPMAPDTMESESISMDADPMESESISMDADPMESEPIPMASDPTESEVSPIVPDTGEGESIPTDPDPMEGESISMASDTTEIEPIPAGPSGAGQPVGSALPVPEIDALAGLGISLAGASGETTPQIIPQTIAASPETAGHVSGGGTNPAPGEIHPVGTASPTVVPGTPHGAGAIPQHGVAGASPSPAVRAAGTSPLSAPSEDTGLPEGITVLGGTAQVGNPPPMGSSIPTAPTSLETSGAGTSGAALVSPESGVSAVPGEIGEGTKSGVPMRPEGSGAADDTSPSVPETTVAPGPPAASGTAVPAEASASAGGTASGEPLADLGITVDPYTPPPPPPPKRVRPPRDRGYWYRPFHNKVPAPYGEDNPEYMASLAAEKAAKAAAAAGDSPAGSVPTGMSTPAASEAIPTAPSYASGSGSGRAGSGSVGAWSSPVSSGSVLAPSAPASIGSGFAGDPQSSSTSPDQIPGISIETPAGTASAVSGDSAPASIPTAPTREAVPNPRVGANPTEMGANQEPSAPIVSLADGPATAGPMPSIPQAPVFRDVEIGGGQITGWETPAGGGMERRFVLYNTEHFEAPKDPYEIVKTADGASWYRQYGRNRGKKRGILPRVPRRKKK